MQILEKKFEIFLFMFLFLVPIIFFIIIGFCLLYKHFYKKFVRWDMQSIINFTFGVYNIND
jgi:hypothetical protein